MGKTGVFENVDFAMAFGWRKLVAVSETMRKGFVAMRMASFC